MKAVSESAGAGRFASIAMTCRTGGAAALSMTYLPGAYPRPREACDIAELSVMIEQLIRDGRRIFGPDYNPFKSGTSGNRCRACSRAEAETDDLYSLFMKKGREGKALTGNADGGSRLMKIANEIERQQAEDGASKSRLPAGFMSGKLSTL